MSRGASNSRCCRTERQTKKTPHGRGGQGARKAQGLSGGDFALNLYAGARCVSIYVAVQYRQVTWTCQYDIRIKLIVRSLKYCRSFRRHCWCPLGLNSDPRFHSFRRTPADGPGRRHRCVSDRLSSLRSFSIWRADCRPLGQVIAAARPAAPPAARALPDLSSRCRQGAWRRCVRAGACRPCRATGS